MSKIYDAELAKFRERCSAVLAKSHGFATTDFNILHDGLGATERAFKAGKTPEVFCKEYAKHLYSLTV